MEYSSSSSSSNSSDDDDEATFAALTAAVNVCNGAAQVVFDRIDAEQAESMELDALDDSSSSDDDKDESTWGGSVPGRRKVYRDFEGAYTNLMKMYFSGEESVYCSTKMFERRFGMPREVFDEVFLALKDTGNLSKRR
jgi:hypothetical protein